MKKVTNCLYWVAVLVSYLVGFTLLGMIVVFMLQLPPDNMFSGLVAWDVMICIMVFAADEKTLEMLKKFAGGKME